MFNNYVGTIIGFEPRPDGSFLYFTLNEVCAVLWAGTRLPL
jgi:hypothetical protein